MFKSISKNLWNQVEKRGVALGDFLSLGEQALLLPYLKALQKEQGHFFFAFEGGVRGAERKRPILLSQDYEGCSVSDFSEIAIIYVESKKETLTHSDVLGSILGLGLERSAVGDLFPYEKGYAVCLKEKIALYVENNLQKTGRIPVSVSSLSIPEHFEIQRKFEELSLNIPSFRLDAVISGLLKMSREQASIYIGKGDVSVNFMEEKRTDCRVKTGDILSLRHHGRYQIGDYRETKKSERFHLTVYRYV